MTKKRRTKGKKQQQQQQKTGILFFFCQNPIKIYKRKTINKYGKIGKGGDDALLVLITICFNVYAIKFMLQLYLQDFLYLVYDKACFQQAVVTSVFSFRRHGACLLGFHR